MRQDLFDSGPVPHLYVPIGREFRSSVHFHARTLALTAQAEADLLPGLRRMLQGIDPTLPVLSLETRQMFRDRNVMLAIVRFGADIFAAFGALALFLAAVGVYGVRAYVVAHRTREIGIRLALGATPGGVVRMILAEGAVMAGVGLAFGSLLSVAAGAGLRGMVYESRGVDAVILTTALVTLTGAALLASWLPARRATRIAPTLALRTE